jgi:hypothetical protein
VILLVASAHGYLLVPSAMLGIVGMDSNPQVTFLVRTLAAAMLALSPGAWAARRRDGRSGQRSVLIGLAGYLFASSLVDLYGFINQVVGIAARLRHPRSEPVGLESGHNQAGTAVEITAANFRGRCHILAVACGNDEPHRPPVRPGRGAACHRAAGS